MDVYQMKLLVLKQFDAKYECHSHYASLFKVVSGCVHNMTFFQFRLGDVLDTLTSIKNTA